MSQIFETKTSLLAIVSLLIVAVIADASTENQSRPQGSDVELTTHSGPPRSGCELIDQEPSSNKQLIEFGSSKIIFDGSIRIKHPNKQDRYIALEDGVWKEVRRDRNKAIVYVDLIFKCARVRVTSSNLAYVNLTYVAKVDDIGEVVCNESDRVDLDHGKYNSPDEASTGIKCLKGTNKGLASEAALNYLEVVDRGF